MDDYISREAAIDAIWKPEVRPNDLIFDALRRACEEEVKHIPAADVRPVVRGEWYWDKDGMDWGIGAWRCSVCHCRPESWWNTDKSSPYIKNGSRYCSNCGAEMREGKQCLTAF